MSDAIFSELRQVRTKLAETAGNDFQRLCDLVAEEAQTIKRSSEWRVTSDIPAAANILKEDSLDPIAEVRRVREQISDLCGNDPEKFAKYLREIEDEMRASGKYKFVIAKQLSQKRKKN